MTEQIESRKEVDSVKVDMLNALAAVYLSHSPDTVLLYAERAAFFADSLNYTRGIAEAYKNRGVAHYFKGNLELGLALLNEGLDLAQQIEDAPLMARLLHNVAGIYFTQENYGLSVEYLTQANDLAKALNDSSAMATEQLSLCACLHELGEPNRAIYYCDLALTYFQDRKNTERVAYAYVNLGESYRLLNDINRTLDYFWKAKLLVQRHRYYSVGVGLYRCLGDTYRNLHVMDSSWLYYKKSLSLLENYESEHGRRRLYGSLRDYYEALDKPDSALYYSRLFTDLLQKQARARSNDKLSAVKAYQELNKNQEKLQVSEQEVEKRTGIIVLIAIFSLLLIISLVLILRLYRSKEMAHAVVRKLNENLEATVEQRTQEIQAKNELLVAYAHANAHRVRGPLARILGILHLMKLTGHDAEMKEYYDRLDENAQELDTVVREINQQLEEE